MMRRLMRRWLPALVIPVTSSLVTDGGVVTLLLRDVPEDTPSRGLVLCLVSSSPLGAPPARAHLAALLRPIPPTILPAF